MGKKDRAAAPDHGPGTPMLNRPNPPAAPEPPERPPADFARAALSSADLRKLELEECQGIVNHALEKYQAQVITERVESVGPDGSPRIRFNITIVSR